MKPKTPEEAMELTKQQKKEADSWAERVDRLWVSLTSIQRENGFAPKMEYVLRGGR